MLTRHLHSFKKEGLTRVLFVFFLFFFFWEQWGEYSGWRRQDTQDPLLSAHLLQHATWKRGLHADTHSYTVLYMHVVIWEWTEAWRNLNTLKPHNRDLGHMGSSVITLLCNPNYMWQCVCVWIPEWYLWTYITVCVCVDRGGGGWEIPGRMTN